MKKLKILILFLVIFLAFTSCTDEDDSEIDLIYNEFCSVIPDNWDAKIYSDDFNSNILISGASFDPEFVIKYFKSDITIEDPYGEMVNPSLILNFFDIKYKQELIDLIIEQKNYSWCITWYYGETEKYFIVTSPCYINHGILGGEDFEYIHILNESLITVIKQYNYFDTCPNFNKSFKL